MVNPDEENRFTPQKLKKHLKHTFFSFFSKFGNFNQVQLQAIPLVLRGENTVLVSGTGSGKTRAVIAPIIEVIMREKAERDLFLYICPTRALVNDTFKRISPPMENMGLKLIRKTGDYPYNERLMKNIAGLIVAIEGTDSLLALHGELLQRVRFVVCDEVHLVDGSPRGDHLRILLKRIDRIRRATGKKINYHILSATISNPQKLANRYFTPNKVIVDKKSKPIEFYLEKYTDGSIVSLERFMRANKLFKALIFCNSRKATEILATRIKKVTSFENVHVHHASLSKTHRENVEKQMNTRRHGICVATMTLELGIDIGDIDIIIMNKPPPSISSFLQRIGRGCRRREDRSLVIGWYDNPYEKMLFGLYEQLAKEGKLDQTEYFARYSVCVQQLFSIGKEFYEEGFTRDDLTGIMKSFVPLKLLQEILDHLIEKDFFFYRHGRYYCSTKLSDRIEKHVIYSNISTSLPYGEIEVRNSGNNEILGYVDYSTSFKGNELLLAGRKWVVEKTGRNKIFVAPIKSAGKTRTFFTPKFLRGFQSLYLAKKIHQSVMNTRDEYSSTIYVTNSLDPNIEGDFIFHFLGTVNGVLFANLLKKEGLCKQIQVINGIYLCCTGLNVDKLLDFEFSIPSELAKEDLSSLAPYLNLGPYVTYLPGNIVFKNISEALDLTEFADLMENVTIQIPPQSIALKLKKVIL